MTLKKGVILADIKFLIIQFEIALCFDTLMDSTNFIVDVIGLNCKFDIINA